jgi:hypothetical protein
VLIVAAGKWAYHCFWKYSAYICQAGRSFRQDVNRIGYYADGAIRPEFPMILGRRDHVAFTYETSRKLQLSGDPFDAAYAAIIEHLIADGRDDNPAQIFFLTPPGHPLTLKIPQPIANTEHSHAGGSIAWTQGHRYVRESAILASPKTTDELSDLQATGS